jgi:hypothetical protein
MGPSTSFRVLFRRCRSFCFWELNENENENENESEVDSAEDSSLNRALLATDGHGGGSEDVVDSGVTAPASLWAQKQKLQHKHQHEEGYRESVHIQVLKKNARLFRCVCLCVYISVYLPAL